MVEEWGQNNEDKKEISYLNFYFLCIKYNIIHWSYTKTKKLGKLAKIIFIHFYYPTSWQATLNLCFFTSNMFCFACNFKFSKLYHSVKHTRKRLLFWIKYEPRQAELNKLIRSYTWSFAWHLKHTVLRPQNSICLIHLYISAGSDTSSVELFV